MDRIFNAVADFIFGRADAQAAPATRRINSQPGGPNGPTITFNNEVANGPSTDLPVHSELAELIEDAAVSTGLDININSTTGGHTAGPHVQGRAADINQINGMRVDDPANAANVQALQDALIQHGNANQVLGPARNANIVNGRPVPITNQTLINDHQDHIHGNVPR